MKAVLTFHVPREIEATISLTMTMEQWAELRARLKDAPFYGPSQWLREAIDDLHRRAEAKLVVEQEPQP